MKTLIRSRRYRPRFHPNSHLLAFKRNLASAESHPLAAFLSFSDEAAEVGLGPDWSGMVEDLEAEGTRLVGALPCPLRIPHGWESQTIDPGAIFDFGGEPCPACGAVR